MSQPKKEWYKQKTTWAGFAAVLAAAGGYFTGDVAAPQALQLGATGLIAAFFRQGLEGLK